jgi:heme-degrading monooxygenase HmoA
MVVNRETGDYLSITIWESRQAQETNAVSNEQASSRDTMTKKYFDGAPIPATYELLSIVE